VKIRHYILTIIAVGLIVLAGFLWWRQWIAQSTGDVIPPAGTITMSSDTPSEIVPPAPSDNDTYSVPDTQPRTMEIPAINSSSYVQPVGIDQHKSIAVPSNINFTGWYTGSALPGNNGVTIVVGHVNGHYNEGIFHNLHKVSIGDVIRVEKGNRETVTYRITESKRIDASDNTSLFTKKGQSANELHLITCIGTYLPAERTFDQRLLVIAEPVS
jgi:LPXTG-site transpeptidase (sortase) family protein